MNRCELEKYIFEKYGVKPEFPWDNQDSYGVFRHGDNKKWFAVIMRIPVSKLGIMENRQANVVNLKITDEVLDLVWSLEGVFPAYHMNKDHWVSVLLDGSVEADNLKKLVDTSFNATAKQKRTIGK